MYGVSDSASQRAPYEHPQTRETPHVSSVKLGKGWSRAAAVKSSSTCIPNQPSLYRVRDVRSPPPLPHLQTYPSLANSQLAVPHPMRRCTQMCNNKPYQRGTVGTEETQPKVAGNRNRGELESAEGQAPPRTSGDQVASLSASDDLAPDSASSRLCFDRETSWPCRPAGQTSLAPAGSRWAGASTPPHPLGFAAVCLRLQSAPQVPQPLQMLETEEGNFHTTFRGGSQTLHHSSFHTSLYRHPSTGWT